MLLKYLPVLPLVAAHFRLTWPPGRGFNVENSVNGPCGGFDEPSAERTQFPIGGGPVQLDIGHPGTNIQILLALGNGDGSYSIELRPTFFLDGVDEFCAGAVAIPSDLGVTEGSNATIQVITNGDPDGGLYQVS